MLLNEYTFLIVKRWVHSVNFLKGACILPTQRTNTKIIENILLIHLDLFPKINKSETIFTYF